jgi:hypothetical protein
VCEKNIQWLGDSRPFPSVAVTWGATIQKVLYDSYDDLVSDLSKVVPKAKQNDGLTAIHNLIRINCITIS